MPVQDQGKTGVGTIRRTVPEDLVFISSCMRDEDLMELRAAGKEDPLSALIECYERTAEPFTGVWEGKPCCIYGIVRLKHRCFHPATKDWMPRGLGAPWMLGTDGVVDARWTFLKQSRPILAELETDFDLLWNQVHSRNTVHIRWLKWLGFQFGADAVHPDTKEIFHNFTKAIHVHH